MLVKKIRFFVCVSACLFVLCLAVSPGYALTVEGKVPQDVEALVAALLESAKKNTPPPSVEQLAPFLQYVQKNRSATQELEKRDPGLGVYSSGSMNMPLQRLVRYSFDPTIPGESLYPTAARRNFWMPESELVSKNIKLWEKMGSADTLVVHGREYEEVTPDASSGCHYFYYLNRMVMLFMYEGQQYVLAVSRQEAPSSIGRRGFILGDDNNWDYVYTNKNGTNLSMVGWADTFMYDSATIAVYFSDAANPQKTEYAYFKWVKAGWSGLNVVEREHIAVGTERFLASFKRILEHPALPKPEEISAAYGALQAKDDASLRAMLAPYAKALEAKAKEFSVTREKDFQAVLKDGKYAESMARQELVSELLKQHMRRVLGFSVLGDPASGSVSTSSNSTKP